MSYASLITEAADLALSMKAKTEQLYKASTHGTPTPVRASATIVSCELRTLTRRWRKVMDAIIILDQAEHDAEVARNAELDAENARLLAEAAADEAGRLARYAAEAVQAVAA